MSFAQIIAWINGHPDGAWTVIFLFCALDSLFVVGVFLPGAVLMFAVGALIALGALDYWTCITIGSIGSFVGDGFNFWLGRHYRERLFNWPPVQRNRVAVDRARTFFARNALASVIVGRFVGLLRPLTPAIAGVSGMSPTLFVLTAAFAGVAWALAYTTVGVLFGASLGLAAEVGTRLATLIVALLVVLTAATWLTRLSVSFLQSHAEHWVAVLLEWSHRHRRLGKMGEALADPEQPETPGLAIAAAILLALGAAWLTLAWGLGWREYPPALDAFVYQTFQGLQTPWATEWAVGLAQLGEWQVYLPIAGAVLIVLLARRRRAAAHWAAALVFAGLIALALFALPTFSTPLEFYHGRLRAHFSGRELILSTVIYGFLAVLLATGRRARARATVYGAALSLLLLILLAELYLGAQWFSMALFAMLIGGLWIGALGLGYRRHGPRPETLAQVLPIALLTFLSASAVHWSLGFDERIRAARPQWVLDAMPQQMWWSEGWSRLPAQRVDMAGRSQTRFNLQWAGGLKEIEAALVPAGWRWPARSSAENLLRWLATGVDIGSLPVLPQVHAGRHQALILRRDIDPQHQTLIQLWPSAWRIEGGERIWVGQIAMQDVRTRFKLFSYPGTDPRITPPVKDLLGQVPGFVMKRAAAAPPLWLLRPRAPHEMSEDSADE